MTIGTILDKSGPAIDEPRLKTLFFEAQARAVSHDGHLAEFGVDGGSAVLLAAVLHYHNRRLRLYLFDQQLRVDSAMKRLDRLARLCEPHPTLVPTKKSGPNRIALAHVTHRDPRVLKVVLTKLLPLMSFGGTIIVDGMRDPHVRQVVERMFTSHKYRWKIQEETVGLTDNSATIFQQRGRVHE